MCLHIIATAHFLSSSAQRWMHRIQEGTRRNSGDVADFSICISSSRCSILVRFPFHLCWRSQAPLWLLPLNPAALSFSPPAAILSPWSRQTHSLIMSTTFSYRPQIQPQISTQPRAPNNFYHSTDVGIWTESCFFFWIWSFLLKHLRNTPL